jgi:glucose-1-phosphate cytidylyltransferase
VTVIDTGLETQTGGRLAKIKDLIDEDFYLTYGDGVGDVDINQLLSCHKSGKGFATLTAVQPPARFGALELTENSVTRFVEKPVGDGGWVNGGFFVLNPKVIELIESDSTVWERRPLEALAKNNQLQSFFHSDFWHPMDTLRDKNYLEELWASGQAPWKNWE